MAAKSTEDLIAGCERGILVTHFFYIRSLDQRTVMLTGLTRDGTFLIEKGKITAAVKNFRWNESPLFMLSKIDEIGKAERVAAGQVMPSLRSRRTSTSRHCPTRCRRLLFSFVRYNRTGAAVRYRERPIGLGGHLDPCMRRAVDVGNARVWHIVVDTVVCAVQLPKLDIRELTQSGERAGSATFGFTVVENRHQRIDDRKRCRVSGVGAPVVGHEIQIRRPDLVYRTHQLMQRCAGQIADIKKAEFAKR